MRTTFLDLPLDLLDMDQTVRRCQELITSGGHHQHVVVNAGKIVQTRADPELAHIIRQCALVNADGQAIVWGGRLLGLPVPERVAGIDLMDRLWELARDHDFGIYLLGATREVVRGVSDIATRRGIRVVGYHDGFWTPDEEVSVIDSIRSARPDLLFVALPSPRKEVFLAKHGAALAVPLSVGVGGSFDVVTGLTKRAPRWAQRVGMEWFFRLAQEPRRMLKRYAVGNTKFIGLVLQSWLRQRLGRVRTRS